jgi:hypothetical protein
MADRTRKLLDQIGSIESAKGYNYEFGNKPINLEEMTLGEVLEHQQKLRSEGAKSSAVGRYQFIHKTLNDIVERNPKDFPKDTRMTPDVQDALATVLLKRRGLDDYLEGNIDTHGFSKNLSKEWASLPDPDTGSSYYDKDGLNKSLIPVESVFSAVESLNMPDEDRELRSLYEQS